MQIALTVQKLHDIFKIFITVHIKFTTAGNERSGLVLWARPFTSNFSG